MGYLFSLISVFACTTKGFCGKKISAYTKEYRSAMLSNSLRMLLCIAIGAVFVIVDGGVAAFRADATVLLISALSGVMTSLLVISWLFSVRRGAYMMVDVFITLGVTVPIILSSIFFNFFRSFLKLFAGSCGSRFALIYGSKWAVKTGQS